MMKRTFALSTALLLALGACGGSEPAEEPAGGGEAPATEPAQEPMAQDELQMPDWYQYDEAANAVTLDIVAGSTSEAQYWNFNGYLNGDVTVVVPVGATVTINFTNEDPTLAHSIGVSDLTGSFPANLEPTPVFDGAITSNAADMQNATASGESETIEFTADQAGEYSLACYVPAHATSGMWIGFTVSAEGEAGVRGEL